jgi:hypothetical protein
MEIINVLQEQLDRECELAKEKLTSANLDLLYKLSATVYFMHGHTELLNRFDELRVWSNGKYDGNIDRLHDEYVSAKAAYRAIGDEAHRTKVVECLQKLLTEVHDMLVEMLIDSDFKSEREEIEKMIRMLSG